MCRGDGWILRVRALQRELPVGRRAAVHPVGAVRSNAGRQVREGGPRLPGLCGWRQTRDRVPVQRPAALLGRRGRRGTAHAQSVPHWRHLVPASVIRLPTRSVTVVAKPRHSGGFYSLMYRLHASPTMCLCLFQKKKLHYVLSVCLICKIRHTVNITHSNCIWNCSLKVMIKRTQTRK